MLLQPVVTTLSLDSIDKFHNSLSARGKSENTLKGYCSDLRILLKEIEEPEIPMEEFEETGMNWLQANRRRSSARTTGRRLTSLRAFARWAKWPITFEDYSAPTPPKSQPHPIPEGIPGVRRLIETTPNQKQKALVALCGFCGLRVSEALACDTEWFDLENMILHVIGKGDKERFVPISEEAWDVLSVPVTRTFVAGGGLVVGFKDRFARRIITELGQRAKLKRHISSHDLRATFATAVYDKTLDLRLVQELLGHSSSQTTEVYTQVAINKMRKAVNEL